MDLSFKRPMFRIPAEAEKGNEDRLLPMTPDFAKLLLSTPERDRHGLVFKLLADDGTEFPNKRWDVGRVIAEIGQKAGVVVDERKKGDKLVRKFATAQDLRRAFGQRWAGRVMPTVLRELMRHADISTTMKYYVGQNAEATAETLWSAVGDTFSDTPSTSTSPSAEKPYDSQQNPVDRGGIEPPTPGFSGDYFVPVEQEFSSAFADVSCNYIGCFRFCNLLHEMAVIAALLLAHARAYGYVPG